MVERKVGFCSGLIGLVAALFQRFHDLGRSVTETRIRRSEDDGAAGAGVPVRGSPPPGLSERGPRQRGPRAWAEEEIPS